MKTFHSVTEAFFPVMDDVINSGIAYESRNGQVLSIEYPYCFRYQYPRNRILWVKGRNDDPFLNFFDSLLTWGTDDRVDIYTEFSPRFEEFGNAGFLYGHYGRRTHNSIATALSRLYHDPFDRRVCIPIYDKSDLLQGGDIKDIPCNVMLIPRVISDFETHDTPKLDLTVINRSNDVAWGLLGANAVQFSALLEIMAKTLHMDMGHLNHVTTNLHGYTEFGPFRRFMENRTNFSIRHDLLDNHMNGLPHILPMDMNWSKFQHDIRVLSEFIYMTRNCEDMNDLLDRNDCPITKYMTDYFKEVVDPIFWLHKQRKLEFDEYELHVTISEIACPAWRKRFELYMDEQNLGVKK